MIRVVMLGRLGNNLFQYALGRVLATKHGVPLVLDASWFNSRTWPYVAPLARLPGFTNGQAKLRRPFSLGSRLLLKLTGKHHWQYLGLPVIGEPENNHAFDPSFLDAPADCLLMGYFQSPLYFQGHEPMLREELATASLGLETGHEALAERIKQSNSVAVHVRRTDYLNNRNLASLEPSYYQRTMERLRNTLPDARFFVFSDDPHWCRETFRHPDTEVMMHSNPFDPLTDLHLMSLASHHIIANSSFSWWAAWLGKKTGQLVVMPDSWFAGGIEAPVEEKRCSGWEIVPAGKDPAPV